MHVCVIGSGVVGVTSAYMLTRQGHAVTLLDARSGPALMSSHANGGQLSYSYVAPLAGPGVISNMPGWLLNSQSPLRFRPRLDPHQWRWLLAFLCACNSTASERSTAQMLTLSYLSRDTLHALVDSEKLNFDLRRNGKLILYRDAALLDKARAQVAYQADHGSRQRVLSRDEVLQTEPALAAVGPQIAGAIYTEDEEAGDCFKFTQGLYGLLQRSGNAACLMDTDVQALRREHGRIVAAVTSRGDVQADAYVVASGMGSRALLRPLGHDVPIYGLKGYSLSVPVHEHATAGPDISVTDYQRRIVYARLGNVLRIAAMVDIGFQDRTPTAHRIAGLKRQVGDTFPHLDLSAATAWAGLRPATPSGKPLIGASPAANNLWVNIGQGALGFTLACGSAALLTSQISRTPAPIDPAPFAP
ncbi:D-amino acid dehydrogenase [Allopusillimonas soli]|uniref:D-amino acid dehydrogenase n=1 Tax=Allopusillimonas soli TaxID=659016 RepID=A0A853FF81_9BURK|nr:D-amino acid dehydrogenase [Allopusillimonas soli]NYT37480.1 D-amino acid dehydrogenase [Allopusillimonas soli]TEA74541.1 D-amino acid dehydrogenase [Allopusillimonas soli]